MTDLQREQIFKMRKEGMGYKKIGYTIGVSRDTVRNYCKSCGLAGYSKEVKDRIINSCEQCGETLIQSRTGRRKRFCCEKCRRTWWKNHPDKIKKSDECMVHFTCKNCGKEVIAYSGYSRKYCSHDCYIKARFWTEG